MGYYTRYEFNTMKNRYKVSEIVLYMKTECFKYGKFHPFKYEFDDHLHNDNTCDFYFDMSDADKWYDHDKEMTELSLKFPETLFYLYGEGEECGDSWYTYYKNGKMQHCPAIITYDKYDESKLA